MPNKGEVEELRQGSIKAQALFFALICLIIVGIIAGGLMHMWESGIRVPDVHEDSLAAFYLAQAGIERAKIWARHNNDYNIWPSNPNQSSWINLDLERRYNFEVGTISGFPDWRLLTATGQRLDSAGNVLAERRIRVVVEKIEDPPTPNIPGNENQRLGTWWEI